MNGKFEEKLAQLAFGDLSPEEAALVEAQVARNPEASRALAEYRDMCGGLRSLAAVPEHQLSNERLRNAILTQGLRTKPVEPASKGFGAGWLWMPVAACVLGFGLITLRNKPAGDPQIVMQTNAGAMATNFTPSSSVSADFNRQNSHIATNPPEKKPVTGMTLAKRTDQQEPDPRNLPKSMRASRFTPDAPVVHPVWGPIDPDANTKLADNHDAKATNPTQNTLSQPVAMSSPIVLIDSNPDSETGAPAATEVGTASNILIGG